MLKFKSKVNTFNKLMKYFLSVLVFLVAFVFPFISISSDADIETIEERVLSDIVESSVDGEEIRNLINTLEENGSWPGINYEDVSRTGFEHSIHSGNLVDLARSYRKKESEYYQSQKVLSAIESALHFWVEHDFISDNWWHNQIGTPRKMVNVMLLVGNKLPEELVEKTQPVIARASVEPIEGKFWGARPGGDRIKIASIEAKNALFNNQEEEFDELIKIIEEEIKFATDRGMQHDYSFHHRHDGVNNTLSYGLGYANAFAEWASYVAGTQYEFSEGRLVHLIDYYLDGICKMMVHCRYPDLGAKNRSVSRPGSLGSHDTEIPEMLLKTSTYRSDELEKIVKIREGEIDPSLTHSKFFWHSEYYIHQRPEYFASVRMFSSRNHTMEYPYNGEGVKNHHLGNGSSFISITGEEYYNIFPVFDWNKIPGTTVTQKPELPPADEVRKKGLTEFVGGVTDGAFGAAAFDFISPHDHLEAKKSWFFFEEEYVCLGAGIRGDDDLPVVTTINQSWLDGEVVAQAGNQQSVLQKGAHELQEARWVWHQNVGYLFPERVRVHVSNQVQTGSWFEINKQSDSPREEISKEVFKLWLTHGEEPNNASYAYMVVPSITEQNMDDRFEDRNVEILANTPEVQAVKHEELNITQAAFYKSGKVQVSDDLSIVADSPGMLLIKTSNGNIDQITAADPSRKLRKMHFSITSEINKEGEDFTAQWHPEKGVSEITVDLPQENYAGQSVTGNF
jgi:chondroitin AC lyase